MSRQSALRMFPPGRNRPLALRSLAEDQPEQDVETPDREEEERGDEGEGVDAMGEDGSSDEHLDEAEGTQPEFFAEHGEVGAEELGWPPDFGEDEDDGLTEDEESVEDCPERAGGLVRHRASTITPS